MLVLSRKRDEAIKLTLPDGSPISIVVLDTHGYGPSARVRLGITAPKSVNIVRSEVAERHQKAARDTIDRDHYCDGAGDA